MRVATGILRAGAMAFCVASGMTGTSAQMSDKQVRAGREFATTRCAMCHALGLTGSSPHKSAPPFRDVAHRYPVASLAEAFAEGTTVGHKDMPEFVLDPAEINALLAFLASLAPRK